MAQKANYSDDDNNVNIDIFSDEDESHANSDMSTGDNEAPSLPDRDSTGNYDASFHENSTTNNHTIYYNAKLAIQRRRFIASGMDSLTHGSKISCEVSLLYLLATKGMAINNYDVIMR
jgi:hypothetical protein